MKKHIFLFLFIIFSNNIIFSYPLSLGGGIFYQFTNYTDKTNTIKFVQTYTRFNNGINLNLFFDVHYIFFDASYKESFDSTNNEKFFSFGLYGVYPMIFKEYVKILFPLIGVKYALDLSFAQKNLFFFSIGLASDLFIISIESLYVRPLFILSISPFYNYENFSGLITEIMIGFNIGWRFFN